MNTIAEADPLLSEASHNDSSDLLSDCRTMLRFALKEGLSVSSELGKDIGILDQFLMREEVPRPIVAIRPGLIKLAAEQDKMRKTSSSSGAEAESQELSFEERILRVHDALSRVVAPATALTLQISEPPPGKHHFLGGMPLVVKLAALMAILCAVGFVATIIPVAAKTPEVKAASPTLDKDAGSGAASGKVDKIP